jgi:HSP20 family molecular chaperone IbpA
MLIVLRLGSRSRRFDGSKRQWVYETWEHSKLKKYLYLTIIPLLLISFSTDAQSSDDLFWDKFDQMMQEEDKEFDAFFDQFEKRLHEDSSNQFHEMKQLQNKMMQRLQGSQKNAFQNHYNLWFKSRYGFHTNELIQEETNNKIVYKLKIPDIDKQKVNITVSERFLKIESDYNKTESQHETQLQKQITQHNTLAQKFVRTIPLPRTADSEKVAYSKEKDTIIITIPKTGS